MCAVLFACMSLFFSKFFAFWPLLCVQIILVWLNYIKINRRNRADDIEVMMMMTKANFCVYWNNLLVSFSRKWLLHYLFYVFCGWWLWVNTFFWWDSYFYKIHRINNRYIYEFWIIIWKRFVLRIFYQFCRNFYSFYAVLRSISAKK